MKNLFYIFIASLLLTACSTYRTLNLGRLTTGMTKAQVESVAGMPYRVLAVNDTQDGYQEVLEYRTSSGEIYALEFWDDYLTGYEFIDEEVSYVPVMTPPAYYPDYGRPIVVIQGRPNRPRPPVNHRPPATPPSRPPANNNRPNGSSRPPQNNSRPTTKPTENSRPVNRPSQNVESTRTPSSGTTGSQRTPQSSGSSSSGRTSTDRTSTSSGRTR